ncbi:MAG: hypothetical protein CUN50_04070 [Candidatus Thermofonsia Clade 1 bacterium]|uniref:SH3b domain-containing protein n=3 Tax=Candidatus Thermofonsia Clade 1 bacterium TaxID=2364210 RepID=A0A2M8PY32_9CHLR|nr:MAG: hypothetical protein CUN50_04070 [Candidatus Thermofonsia Clade 1 bacterium]
MLSFKRFTAKARLYSLFGLCLAAVLIASLAAPAHSSAQGAADGKVRFVHGVAGAPDVDIYLDGQLAASALSFGTATRFLKVPTGTRALAVTVSGNQQPIFQGNVPIGVDFGYTVVIQGTPNALEVGLYEDDLAPTRPGHIRFGAIHAVKDAPPVDVIQVIGTTEFPLAQGLAYGQPYGTVDIPLSGGDLVVVPAGAPISSTLARINQLPLAAGTYNTIVVLGSGPSAALLPLSEPVESNAPANSALVSFVHASAEAPAVDIYVNDVLAAVNVPFGVGLPHIWLPAGEAKIVVRAAGSSAESEPALTAETTLPSGIAATVVISGALNGLTATVYPDNISPLAADQARVRLINALNSEIAFISLDNGTVIQSSQASGIELRKGAFSAEIGIFGAELGLGTTLALSGGVLHNFILAGTSSAPELIYVAASLSEQLGSAVAVDAAAPPAAATALPPDLVMAPTATPIVGAIPTVAPVLIPTVPVGIPTVAPPVAQQPTPTPFGATGITGIVDTDPGVNLKIREYPRTDAKTLALAPSRTLLRIEGVRGPARLPNEPVPAATATLDPQGARLEDIWVFVAWELPDGGKITGWTKAEFLIVTDARGRRVLSPAEMLAFPQVPENEFGEISSSLATPVPPDTKLIIATVNVDPGVNLQMRRTPDIAAESLALLPLGTQLVVLEKTEVESRGGLVGEPSSLTWLYVRFTSDSGTLTGWVNSQFVVLTRDGRPFSLDDVPTATEIRVGGLQGSPSVAPPPPATQTITATIDKVDPGANLHLRRNPDASSESLALIPSGTQLPVLGRNGPGTWLQVEYNGVRGWINASFVSVTRGGRAFKIAEIANVTDEPDTAEATATPAF